MIADIDYAALLPGVPFVESPFFDEIAAARAFDPETRRIATELHEKGFAIFRFPDDKLEERAARIKDSLSPRFDFDRWRKEGWARNEGMRVQDAWTFDEDVRAIAANQYVQELLSTLFGRKAWPFQTLNFPVGTQQHFHSDSVHFSSIPERFMCGVWVALEDIEERAGPLEYYAGSHKWPILYNELIGIRITAGQTAVSQAAYEPIWREMVRKFRVEPSHFLPRKGEALIWLSNLLHGGSRQSDPALTRWSQVTHYFFEGCCYITPMMSDVPLGKLHVRDLIDIATGEPVPNKYLGALLSDFDTPEEPNSRPWFLMRWLWGKRGLPVDFDSKRYLELNPDVKAARIDASEHYLRYGIKERRRYH